ncbi:MAG: aspartyl-tRNA(Asn)/glutamyl-tRNA(Gln) amidotransferase subunit A [Gammaproteobacteria bacterium]|jgi:aspartyl-tRNA(Asn)/glutamyl-tRNA(Gln) amidotransferase subunit A
MCTGYHSGGLPMSMQIAGRPFDEATVFRVGAAYAPATQWREHRPKIMAG